ncbi:DegT/DnrJ/EryC1/StrS family aminotransferase [Streptomyces marincola]|uniref:dTDP-4-amino-4,6-dideoxygalactose transaminase n=1 Tax=Streptomyces marincola TaxID=2878388 RepID=A0A1W7D180_9ACTN|nr:DegT/DnrJ/EryC1/StrS family aminotransferase [Streptomyces marincola]ARQ70755.1 hypothetical protein CAG99_19625 [Streptomyces marincola]
MGIGVSSGPPGGGPPHPAPSGGDAADLRYVAPPERPLVELRPSRLTGGRALRALAARPRPERARRLVAGRLRRMAGGGPWTTAVSGRAALYLALRSLGAGPGVRVVLSTFNCTAVADAVLATGATPVLVDCDAAHGAGVGAADVEGAVVVLTNALGLDEWRAHGADVRRRGARPVLDLAQAVPAGALLSRYDGAGCPLVLSFGEGKALGGIGGGAVLVPGADASAGEGSWGNGPAPGGELAAVGRELYRSLLARAPGGLRAAHQRRLRRAPGWSTTKADHLPDAAQAVPRGPLAPWRAAVAAAQLERAEALHRAATDLHERVAAAVRDRLTTCRLVPSTPDLTSGIELVFTDRGTRYAFAGALAARGVPATWNYYPLHLMAPYRRYAAGPLPGAEHLWPRVLTVPKQPQPRMSARALGEALLAADAAAARGRKRRGAP